MAGLAADDGIVMTSYIHDRLKTVRIESIEQLREEVTRPASAASAPA